MRKADKYKQCTAWFEEHIPLAETELHFRNDYELLVAVALSAQCTDKRVNMVTPALFEAYPTVQALSTASVEDIFEFIRSISYPNNKAKHLHGMAQRVMTVYGGEIPKTRDELVTLPGVGRKTANVLTSVLHNEPNMPVDTHVFRVSQRLGLVKPTKSFRQVEDELLKHVPPLIVPRFHHWLILHGRYTCLARSPQCQNCGLTPLCTWYARNHKPTQSSSLSDTTPPDFLEGTPTEV